MQSSDNTPGSCDRLSVTFEQDVLPIDAETSTEIPIRSKVSSESPETPTVDDNNNSNNNNNSSNNENPFNESQDFINTTHPPVVRRRKNTSTRQTPNGTRDRSFVHAAGDAVVGGARSVARTIKRMSLIESSSSSNNNNNNSSASSSMRERTLKKSRTQDGVDRLKANAKRKEHYNSTPSLPQSYISYIGPLQSSGSAQDLASSPSSSPKSSQSQGQVKGGNNTAKQHELQQASSVAGISTSTLTSATAAVTGAAIYSIANGVGSVVATPPEKEKKRKEVSSSRVKKFRRHFSQVSNDEHLINYFSCALVGDIPLQGHLYITDQHFAFYSNVFGYVTKVVLPTSSVTRISKEKTAKIIPNAVGVATADERHVFGSFISREAAFRLMCAVCPHLNHGAEILLPKPLAEEYLIDDESSCSISGNESPPQLHDPAAAAAVHEQQALLRQRAGSDRHPEMQSKSLLNDDIDGPINIRSSAPPVVHYKDSMPHHLYQLSSPGAGSRQIFTSALPSVMGSSGASSSSSPITVLGTGVSVAVPTTPINTGNAAGLDAAAAAAANENNAENPPRSRWRIIAASARTHLPMGGPALTELQVLYLGITLAVMLALFSVFLLYRVLDIEAKSSLYNMPVDFNSRGGVDDDIFAEALHWQKKLQEKTTAEAQYILAKNLEQISKVRRSLETLSMLIHDRSTGYAESLPDMNSMPKDAVFASDASD
ncbi:sterol 3-beta-glucosyltransferase isoform X3 [Drosophila grimshawi]|uniref:GH24188 n=1 Tax=Drosophila grimshawi TaxID=7222 RepID=B4JN82_DROGR|nr:sterol 3-beta-glucosyltransferase isoform X3 [Drosophila grimshawi]XP_043072172.1 sterol 3-beta-glucosyltransferase isoform X3 [Drosophila grimshawi]EDV92175.1 GH24188 [Drosophila grimshawi]